jgi:hypothetical protein
VNGELAQLICLASHGTVWLAGGSGQDPPTLDRDNSTFRYVGSVSFRFGGPLVAMATRGWVFGAMGSWNDQYFSQPEDQDRYREVSRRLYAADRRAFLASINGELAAAPDPA